MLGLLGQLLGLVVDKRLMTIAETSSALRILLVDDEPHVLQGLRRLLRSQRSWRVQIAVGGADALAMLSAGDTDVMVTDFRMPGMDGVTLLEAVRRRHPEVVRIMLSGHVDHEATLRTTSVAHQYLSKPCDAETLCAALERAANLRPFLHKASIRKIIGGLGTLPSAPELWLELERRLADPDASAADVAAVVSRDVAMSTKVLQLVNSAFMGLGREISSISEAVAYLGISMVRCLVFSLDAFRMFEGAGAVEGFSIDALSRHGQACSRLARAIMDNSQRDHAALASLLQDVGQLVLAECLPHVYKGNLEFARAQGLPLHTVEAERLGYTHADVGAYLLGLWGLPEPIVTAVARSHAPLHEVLAAQTRPADATRLAHELVQVHCGAAADPTDIGDADGLRDYVVALGAEVPIERWSALAAAAQRDRTGATL